MAFCTKCGAQIPDGARFCTSCGKEVYRAPAAESFPEAEIRTEPPNADVSVPEQDTAPQDNQPSSAVESAYMPAQNPESFSPQAKPAADNQMPPVYSGSFPSPENVPEQNSYAAYGYSAPPGAPSPKKKNVGLIVGLIAGSAVVLAGIVLLFTLVIPRLLSKTASVSDAGLIGTYTAESAEQFGFSVEPSTYFGDDFYIELLDDGSCRIRMEYAEYNGKWDRDSDGSFSIDCDDFTDLEGTLNEDGMILEDIYDLDLDVTLRKIDGEMPAISDIDPDPAEDWDEPEVISEGDTVPFESETRAINVPSSWYGSLAVTNHVAIGSNTYFEEGVSEIWSVIDYGSDDGDIFFECYTDPFTPDIEGEKIILSEWIEMESPVAFEAEIGEDDAWIGNIYLTEADEDALSCTLENGAIVLRYHYMSSSETCDLMFFLREEGASWNYETDPVPPGME